MTYPNSSSVSAGQPTAVDHYNDLRLDALFFGQAAVDAVNLATLFSRFEKNVNLELLDTDRIRLAASPTSTVELMIGGYPVQAVANVDLAAGDKPSGGAATWYVFAVRTASSTTFTLDANTSSTEWAGARRIGSFDWDGAAITETTIATEYADTITDLITSTTPPQAAQGRLTLSSGAGVPVSNTTGSSVLYTPWNGEQIDLYDGATWVPYSFSELSLSFSGVAADTNHDIFAYLTGGAVALAKEAWTDGTTRNEAISLQNGRYVKTSATGYLYLGTVRTSALSTISDTDKKRFVWNYYNRVSYKDCDHDSTSSYNHNTASWVACNSSNAAWKHEFIIGVEEYQMRANAHLQILGAAARLPYFAIGLDALTPFHGGNGSLVQYYGQTHTPSLDLLASVITTSRPSKRTTAAAQPPTTPQTAALL
jgi:hypothetical protein